MLEHKPITGKSKFRRWHYPRRPNLCTNGKFCHITNPLLMVKEDTKDLVFKFMPKRVPGKLNIFCPIPIYFIMLDTILH